MKATSLFLPRVNLNTYGAPRILQMEEILNACIEFCERSRAWIQTLQPTQLGAGINSYDFTLDPNVLVVQIMSGHLVGNSAPKVHPRAPDWLDDNYPGWEDGAQVGRPLNVTQLSPDQFMPVPWDDGTGYQMVLRCALKPSPDAVLVPDFIYNDYRDTIVSGALARLFSVRGKSWSDPNLAVAHAGIFDAACIKALRRQEKAFGRAKNRVKGSYV